MLRYNPFYYCPVEANQLYHSKKGTKEFRSARRKIPFFLIGKSYEECDLKTAKLTSRYNRMLSAVVFIFAPIVFVMLIIAALWVEGVSFISDIVGASAFVLGLTAAAVMLILTPVTISFKYRLIEHYLADYTPVCEVFDEMILRRIGLCRLRTISNKAEIEEGIVDKVEVDGGYVQSGEDDENEEICVFTDCACISCKRIVRNSEINEFDSNNSAICPYCGKVSLMYDTGEISPDFLEKIHTYWNVVDSLKSQE